MLRIAAFVPEDWDSFRPRQYERRFEAEIGDGRAYAAELDRLGHAWVLLDDRDRAIGCGGMLQIKSGVGELWGRFSTAFKVEKPSRLWAEAFHVIDSEIERQLTCTFHRLQIAIPIDFEPGLRFARRLKFQEEGILRQFGVDRADYVAFSRCR